MDLLNVKENIMIDDSIEVLQDRQYESQNLSALNINSPISIIVNSQDIFCLPSKAYILIEGTLSPAVDAAYAADVSVGLTNNAPMFLFTSIRYDLNDTTVENINHSGVCLSMLNALRYGSEFDRTVGLNQCYSKDTDADLKKNLGFKARQTMTKTGGKFSFIVPLRDMFGFCMDYEKVIYGAKHTITLTRTANDNAIVHGAGVPDGKIVLTKLALFMPQVRPALAQRAALMKLVESRIDIPIAYRGIRCESNHVPQSTSSNWRLSVSTGTVRPRYIVVAFQTDRLNNQEKNASVFDHVDVESVTVSLNSERYPLESHNLNFADRTISRGYFDFEQFKAAFYSTDSMSTSCGISPSEFIDFYPIFVIDLRYQMSELKSATQDIVVNCKFRNAAPANTQMYAIMLSDTVASIKSNGYDFQIST
jgi:hypothetical protein